MVNQKRGLTDSVSCPTMEIPGCRINYGNPEQKKTPFEPRWAKQQTRSSGPDQLK